MKEQNKATDRYLSKTNVNNILNGEFKGTIIRILAGLEKQVEIINETINRKIRNNTEIKGPINEKHTCCNEQQAKRRGGMN